MVVDLGVNQSEFSSYVFSLAPSSYNNGGTGTDLSANSVVKQDFTALLGTNQISGFIRSNGITPLAGLQVEARADDINGTTYQSQTTTDASGHYIINVPNGTWRLNLNCCTDCNSDGLPPIYQCPDSQTGYDFRPQHYC